MLNINELQRLAPAAFATEPSHSVSDKYNFIPTIDVISHLMKNDFVPVRASQVKPKRGSYSKDFGKHMIQFRHPSAVPVNGVFPEVILVNDHQGGSAYKLMAGLFRLVCSNGMIVSEGEVSEQRVRHIGNFILDDILEGAYQIINSADRNFDKIERFQRIKLDQFATNQFLIAAMALRWDLTKLFPQDFGYTRRFDDAGDDLWRIFNRAQEGLIQGKFGRYTRGRVYDVDRKRLSNVRAITSITENNRINKALWELAEETAVELA